VKRVRVKICGITRVQDALMAADLGADMVGLIFADSSRQIDEFSAARIVKALPPFVTTVGVFMDQPVDRVRDLVQKSGVDIIQLHGDENIEDYRILGRRLIKRVCVRPNETAKDLARRVRAVRGASVLLDPGAGAGKPFEWAVSACLDRPFILAGGLNPDNVRQAVQITKAAAVDVCSGIESVPGVKDTVKMRQLLQEVR